MQTETEVRPLEVFLNRWPRVIRGFGGQQGESLTQLVPPQRVPPSSHETACRTLLSGVAHCGDWQFPKRPAKPHVALLEHRKGRNCKSFASFTLWLIFRQRAIFSNPS